MKAKIEAVVEAASWMAEEGVDRARHTLASFFKSYLRGVVPRLTTKFDSLHLSRM